LLRLELTVSLGFGFEVQLDLILDLTQWGDSTVTKRVLVERAVEQALATIARKPIEMG
jgi:hypothetical protein